MSLPPLDFDRAATTPLLPAVLDAMGPWLGAPGANASAVHAGGRAARRALEEARETVALALGARPSEVVFTSGATEADQLAIDGVMEANPEAALLVARSEHPAVVRASERQERRGRRVVWLPTAPDGRVAMHALAAAVAEPGVKLLALMRVNNETGAINDVPTAVAWAHANETQVLCDAVQAVGWESIENAWGADLVALSAHKVGGPTGVGALLVRDLVRFMPQALGGSQERGRRAGTTPLALVVGFAAAMAHASANIAARAQAVAAVRDRFEAQVLALPGVQSSLPAGTPRSPKHAHLQVSGLNGDGETLLMNLDAEGVWASMGSACSAGSLSPSPVLLAMGWDEALARSGFRFTFGEDHTMADADAGAARFARALARTRAMAPAREGN